MADINILNNSGPIDRNDGKYQELLQNLQGNILKGHGRDHAALIFFRFNKPPEQIRPGLIEVLRYVTSAEEQLREADEYRRFQVAGGLFGNFFLTATGYEALGFKEQLDLLFPWEGASSFHRGMRKVGVDDLGDPPLTAWETPYQGQIDALLLLADDDEPFLLRHVRQAIDQIGGFATIVTVEHGGVLRDAQEQGVEHFGYADGRSQPIFLRDDMTREGPTDQWNPVARLNLALVPDPASDAKHAFGSFFVYRKLEQNVHGFVARERQIATQMGLEGQDRERVGAMVIGRFRDGTPLVRSPKMNNFDYKNDPDGGRCPFHAHIRKTNPRGEAVGFEKNAQSSVRIVRRGLPYGKATCSPTSYDTADNLPSDGVGLLFMCFQRTVESQFNLIQQLWANRRDLPHKGGGRDCLIGQGKIENVKWPSAYGVAEPHVEASFGSFVKMKGGEYFFAPSIPFLRTLVLPVQPAVPATKDSAPKAPAPPKNPTRSSAKGGKSTSAKGAARKKK